MDEAFQEQVLGLIKRLKAAPASREYSLPVFQRGTTAAWLDPVTWEDAGLSDSVALLAEWRRAAADAFPAQFPVTLAGTQNWLCRQVLDLPDRLLFWVTGVGGQRVGHVGLYRFDFAERQVEIDNIVRGVPRVLPGVMHASIATLLNWTFDSLGMETVFLRVFSDNARALQLYGRCGFRETMRMPLVRVQEGEVVRWQEVDGGFRQPVNRYFVTMGLPRTEWQASAAAA